MCILNVFHESNISCINVSLHSTEQSSLCFYVDHFAAAAGASPTTASLHAEKNSSNHVKTQTSAAVGYDCQNDSD